MQRDYQLFLDCENDLSSMVCEVYELYKPYIMKKAFFYQRCSRGQILAEDFASDVYVKLYEFLQRIKKCKIKDENKFSFFIYVKYASLKIFDNNIKHLNFETCCMDDEKENKFESQRTFSETTVDFDKFFDKLSERQIKILKNKEKNVHEKTTLKQLKISHGTYITEIHKMKMLFKDYINIPNFSWESEKYEKLLKVN